MVKVCPDNLSIKAYYHQTKKDSGNPPTKGQFRYSDHIRVFCLFEDNCLGWQDSRWPKTGSVMLSIWKISHPETWAGLPLPEQLATKKLQIRRNPKIDAQLIAISSI
jgi:hypothetical protein